MKKATAKQLKLAKQQKLQKITDAGVVLADLFLKKDQAEKSGHPDLENKEEQFYDALDSMMADHTAQEVDEIRQEAIAEIAAVEFSSAVEFEQDFLWLAGVDSPFVIPGREFGNVVYFPFFCFEQKDIIIPAQEIAQVSAAFVEYLNSFDGQAPFTLSLSHTAYDLIDINHMTRDYQRLKKAIKSCLNSEREVKALIIKSEGKSYQPKLKLRFLMGVIDGGGPLETNDFAELAELNLQYDSPEFERHFQQKKQKRAERMEKLKVQLSPLFGESSLFFPISCLPEVLKEGMDAYNRTRLDVFLLPFHQRNPGHRIADCELVLQLNSEPSADIGEIVLTFNDRKTGKGVDSTTWVVLSMSTQEEKGEAIDDMFEMIEQTSGINFVEQCQWVGSPDDLEDEKNLTALF